MLLFWREKCLELLELFISIKLETDILVIKNSGSCSVMKCDL